MKILCIGQAAYDITLPVDHYPEENKKVYVSERVECGGGSASNCAYLLGKWGMEVYFAGVVGNDHYGDSIKEEMLGVNVNLKYLQRMNGVESTVSYIIANAALGSRTIICTRSKSLKMYNVEIDNDFDVILFDGYEKDVVFSAIERNPDAIKIIDAGKVNDDMVELAHMADYVVCSNNFAQQYTNMIMSYDDIESIKRVYDKLKEDFSNNVIITLEDKGCFTYLDEYIIVPTLKVNAVDSTGAGDIYHGAFTYCIAQGYDLLKTMKISNIAGALSVQRVGSRYSVFELEEVMNKYNENVI